MAWTSPADRWSAGLGGLPLTPQTWDDLKSAWHVGQIIEGRVDRYMAFGAFVEIEAPFLGLIENPNFSSDQVRDDRTTPEVGALVQAMIVQFDDRNHQVRLSLRPEDLRSAGPTR